MLGGPREVITDPRRLIHLLNGEKGKPAGKVSEKREKEKKK